MYILKRIKGTNSLYDNIVFIYLVDFIRKFKKSFISSLLVINLNFILYFINGAF
jgi:hypothetical protein